MSVAQLSVSAATIAMVTSMLGGGVLFLPSAFGVLGFLKGFLVLFLCSSSCFYTLYCISYCAHSHRQSLLKSTDNAIEEEKSKNRTQKQRDRVNLTNSDSATGNNKIHKQKSKINLTNSDNPTEDNEVNCGESNPNIAQTENRGVMNLSPQKSRGDSSQAQGAHDSASRGSEQSQASSDGHKGLSRASNSLRGDSVSISAKHSEDAASIDAGLSYYSVAARRSAILAVAVDACIVLQGCGSCVCYVRTLVSWVRSLLGVTWPTYAMAFGCTAPLFALALQPSLSALRHASLLSVSAVAFLAVLLAAYALLLSVPQATALPGTTLDAASRMLFALGAHQNAVQVFAELRSKDLRAMAIAGACAYATGTVLYAAIGACGLKAAGKDATDEILNALLNPNTEVYAAARKSDPHLIAPKIASVLFFATLGCAFPMQMHPTRNSLVNILELTKLKVAIQKNTQRARTMATCLLTALVLSFACVPNLDPARVVSFIGATATVGITFVFPAILHAQCIGKITFMSITSGLVAILGVALSIALVTKEIRSSMG